MNLEEELRIALRREQPSPEFTRRVLRHAGGVGRRRSATAWIGIAALFAAAAFVTSDVRESQRRREAEARKAGRDLVIALKITSNKLHTASRMIRRRTNGV